MINISGQLDTLEVGILLHHPQTGEILYANDFAEELYGYSEEELMTMDIADFSSDSFSHSEAVQRIRAAADGQSQQFEWRNRKSTGELYWVEVRLSDFMIDDMTYVVALVRDITTHKMNLRHLRVLTRITRHNLRNKLNVLEGAFEYFDDRTKDDEMLDRMRRSISELLNLTSWIDTIKSVNRRNTTGEACDLCPIIAEVTESYQSEYPDINWQFDCDHTYVIADSTLRTAVTELIENAVRHNPHEDLEITVSVTENLDDQQICIRISDTGIPIPEIEIEPLVGGYDPDPLEHGENVGLWEVQTITNAHGGRLSIIENNAEQKIIEIILPRAKSPQ